MTVKEWLANTIKIKSTGIQEVRPRLFCNDGYSVSVQASECHYCYPRLNGSQSYDKVELGFPSEKDELIDEYGDYGSDRVGTIYGYVPIEIVEKLIEKHGGIKGGKTMSSILLYFEMGSTMKETLKRAEIYYSNNVLYMKLAYEHTDDNGARKIIIRRIPYAELVERTNSVEKEEWRDRLKILKRDFLI